MKCLKLSSLMISCLIFAGCYANNNSNNTSIDSTKNKVDVVCREGGIVVFKADNVYAYTVNNKTYVRENKETSTELEIQLTYFCSITPTALNHKYSVN